MTVALMKALISFHTCFDITHSSIHRESSDVTNDRTIYTAMNQNKIKVRISTSNFVKMTFTLIIRALIISRERRANNIIITCVSNIKKNTNIT